MTHIVPTIVPGSLADIKKTSEKYASFTDFFQIDVADGKFAPNTTWIPGESDKLPGEFSYEVHMMVSEPRTVGAAFAKAGAHTLIGHIETLQNPADAKKIFNEWRTGGVESIGLAVLLQTPIEALEPYLPFADFVLFMTIARIGVQGFPFEKNSIAKIAAFKEMHPDTVVAVDGGVSEKNIAALARAGATRFGVGSAISRSDNPAEAYERLKTLAESAIV